MKSVILAGGLGTRLSEETHAKPKPMVEIGGKPILWHIMKSYSAYGVNDFVICCGYKGYLIKEYFANYFLHTSDVTFHMDEISRMEVHNKATEPWKVTLIDTGENTQTGGRLLRVKEYVNGESFCFTYGDGLSNVNILKLREHHFKEERVGTLTAVRPPGRYGQLEIESGQVKSFQEKHDYKKSFINGGFFMLNSSVFDYIEDDESSFEIDVLPKLANEGELSSFVHDGFWQAMDTLRDRNYLESLWSTGSAPWRSW